MAAALRGMEKDIVKERKVFTRDQILFGIGFIHVKIRCGFLIGLINWTFGLINKPRAIWGPTQFAPILQTAPFVIFGEVIQCILV